MTTRIKLRRDTATNWTTANPVLALAEPGVETDTNKMKIGDGTTAWDKLQYIDGADVTRISAGWITSVGNLPEVSSGEGDDFWFDSVTVDSDLNSYYVGGNEDDGTPWAVKLNPMGGIEWQTKLNPFDGYTGEGVAIQIDPTNGDLVVIADMWTSGQVGGDAGMLLYRLDPDNGSLIGDPLRIRDDESANTVDIYPTDIKMDGNDAVIFGERDDDKFTVEVAKQTGSSGTSIVILASVLESGAYPRSYNDWYISGTDITGEGLVTAVNNYENVGTSGGGGNGAQFNFSFYIRAGSLTKTTGAGSSGGTGYAVDDVLTVLAADIGATVNATITVTGIGGSGEITNFTCTNYTPDTTKIKLTIDPNGGSVDFSNSGTWNLIQYKNSSGFVYSQQGSGWTSIVGDSDNDSFSAGAIDSNGNVYAAGYHYDEDYYGGWDRGMLVKFNNQGVVQYKKCFDFDGSGGEGSGGYTGIVIDSEDNVYIAGDMEDFDGTGNDVQVITKINSAGVMQWQKRFSEDDDPYNMWNMCLAIDSDDNLYLAAEYNSPTSLDDDFFFAKFDSSGNVIWQRMLKSYGDADSSWTGAYQALKVQGDKLFYCASTETYSTNYNESALAFSINTDGSGVGTIANNTWEWAEVELNWTDTTNQQTTDLQVSVATAVFTTDEPVTGTDTTSYSSINLQVYTGIGGQVNGVRTISFEDGTEQTTAAKPAIAPIVEGTLSGNNSLYLRLDHAGKFIRVNFTSGNQDIYVPLNNDVPFEIGTVITIIADDINDNENSIYLYSEDGYRSPTIVGVGFPSDSAPDWWVLNDNTNNGKTGIYTLMKIDTDRWVLSGPDIEEQWD
jgi:Major tropism determinant N-terminal domain